MSSASGTQIRDIRIATVKKKYTQYENEQRKIYELSFEESTNTLVKA